MERKKDINKLIRSLETEDLKGLVNKLDENNVKDNPLLLAAEYGSYKILKSILDLKDQIVMQDFSFDDCNEEGENVLHLGKSY